MRLGVFFHFVPQCSTEKKNVFYTFLLVQSSVPSHNGSAMKTETTVYSAVYSDGKLDVIAHFSPEGNFEYFQFLTFSRGWELNNPNDIWEGRHSQDSLDAALQYHFPALGGYETCLMSIDIFKEIAKHPIWLD